jgi:hypothetical protein
MSESADGVMSPCGDVNAKAECPAVTLLLSDVLPLQALVPVKTYHNPLKQSCPKQQFSPLSRSSIAEVSITYTHLPISR